MSETLRLCRSTYAGIRDNDLPHASLGHAVCGELKCIKYNLQILAVDVFLLHCLKCR
jgi:hypothetical protein